MMGSTIVCPDCASTEIRPSSSKNPWERIYALSGFKPYFCENCYLRFFAKLTSAGPGDDDARDDYAEVRTQGPRVRTAYIVFALAVIVAIGLGLGLLQTGGPSPRLEAARDGGEAAVKPLLKLAEADQPSPEPIAAQPTAAPAQAVKPPATQPISQPTTPPPAPRPTVTEAAAPTTAPPPSTARPPALVKPAPVKPAAPSTATAYTIQLGAFTTMDKAAQFQAGLTKKGLATRVDRVINPDGKLWFKVRVGAYATRAEAKQAVARVAKQSGLKPYITTK